MSANPALTVRPAVTADAAAVTRLLRASYPVLLARAYDAKVLQAALPGMTRANPALLASGRYFLAHVGDTLVGVGGWSAERPGGGEIAPGLGHVRHFATHPVWLRCGVGRAVYQRCEAQARESGCCVLECYASLNGEPFYAALGFRRVGTTSLRLSPKLRMETVRMIRELA